MLTLKNLAVNAILGVSIIFFLYGCLTFDLALVLLGGIPLAINAVNELPDNRRGARS